MNTIVFDVDGTICPIKKANAKYKDLIPYAEIIFGKPYLGKEGFYVDDKTLRLDELLSMNKENIILYLKGSNKNEV